MCNCFQSKNLGKCCVEEVHKSIVCVEELFAIVKVRVHCFSMQVVMNECFLLNSQTKFGVDSSCRFREKRIFNSKK